uniref:ATP synthase F0 subunit 6 n=1 Tax=Hydroptila angulata TaxID=1875522 RepID=UPI0022DCE251|nr:ATP synthase F0 subunit 6 [Hydroptila angulata]UZZ44043.1 ATP synthase F0 subunit 6 [Hydroptila angulata]
MMNNLFSIFDPSTNIMNISLNWLSTMVGIFYFPLKFWIIPNRSLTLTNKISLFLHEEFNMLLGKNKLNGSTFIFISIFYLILFNNFLGLFPYIFTSSSHMTFTLAIALPLWISFMLYGWILKTNHMFTHLVPLSTPTILTPFMVMIESISNFIRPGTLAVRLTANMIAGHLLLTLMSSMALSLPKIMIVILILTQILLILLEIAVSIIQSYVFITLSNLYSSEVN